MTDTEKLNDALGELLYAVCMADGVIQAEETEKLDEILKHHEWAKNIKWSFNYEANKGNDLEDVYQKALQRCKEVGPNPAYNFFLDILERAANASDGIDRDETKMIGNFSNDLRNKFLEDLEKNELV